jgi:hypothetical protein
LRKRGVARPIYVYLPLYLTLIIKMATAMCAIMGQLQNMAWLNPKSPSNISDISHKKPKKNNHTVVEP